MTATATLKTNEAVEEHMLAAFREHTLREVTPFGSDIRAFVMARPATGVYRVNVTFAFNQVVLTGDVQFNPGSGRYGVVSYGGYGLEWFVSELDYHYLAEKFAIRHHWDAKRALRLFEGYGLDTPAQGLHTRDEGYYAHPGSVGRHVDLEKLRGILSDLRAELYDTQEDFAHDLADAGWDFADGIPGWGLDLTAAGWLSAAQRRFAELYWASRTFGSVPKPKRKGDWTGRLVRLRKDLETRGGTTYPAGFVMQVTRNHGGLHLMTPVACPTCEVGQRHAIRKVSEREVELLPEGYLRDDHGR